MRPYSNYNPDSADLYRPRLAKPILLAITLVILSVSIFIGFSRMSMDASDKRMRSREMTESLLCTTEVPCRVILTALCDKEPVEIQFVSPSGQIYTENDMDAVSRSENGLDITMELFTGETGDWGIRYNQLTNSRIKFSVKQEYADQVYLQDVELVKGRTTGSYYLEFVPVYKDGSDTQTMLHCSVSMDQIPSGKAKVVYIGEVRLNTKARLQLDTENLPDAEYYLDLSTSGETEGYTANKRAKVELGPMPDETEPVSPEEETVSENQTETAPTETPDGTDNRTDSDATANEGDTTDG